MARLGTTDEQDPPSAKVLLLWFVEGVDTAMTAPRTKAGLDLYHDTRNGMKILQDAMRFRILAIEAEAGAAPDGLREALERALDLLGGMWSWNPAGVPDSVAHLWWGQAGRVLEQVLGRIAVQPDTDEQARAALTAAPAELGLDVLARAIAEELERAAPEKIEGGSPARRQWLADILAVQMGFNAVPSGMIAFVRYMDDPDARLHSKPDPEPAP
jgi:hypothetical protein